jgi:hypothetical protein
VRSRERTCWPRANAKSWRRPLVGLTSRMEASSPARVANVPGDGQRTTRRLCAPTAASMRRWWRRSFERPTNAILGGIARCASATRSSRTSNWPSAGPLKIPTMRTLRAQTGRGSDSASKAPCKLVRHPWRASTSTAPWRRSRVIDVRDAPASRPLALGDALSPSRRLSMPHPCVTDGRQHRDGGIPRRQGPGERVGNTPARFLLGRVLAQVGHRQCDVIRRKPGIGWGGTRGQPTLPKWHELATVYAVCHLAKPWQSRHSRQGA